ncbi:MAG TPA: GAF domain-containing protein [Gemmatimonadaceae bacterium]|nr:GAF domain-containing protein [Gemmatimonadaceae bacterium]
MTGRRTADDSPPTGAAPVDAGDARPRAAAAAPERELLDALREANRRLEFHTNNSPLAVVEWDADFRIARWSEGAARLFGWTAAEMLGRTIQELRLVHEEDLPYVERNTRAMVDGSAPRNVSRNRNYTRDGRLLYCEWYNSALIDERTGHLVSVHSEVLDVTARRRAQGRAAELHATTAALARSLTRAQVAEVIVAQMRGALGAVAGGVLELTPDGREYVLVHAAGFPEDRLRSFSRFPSDAPFPSRDVARTREPVFVGSREQWIERYESQPGADHRAWAAVPLLIDDGLLGCITLSFAVPRAFEPADQEFMMALANQCAQALDRARLFEAERTARLSAEGATDRLRFLAEASQVLASSLDLAQTLANFAAIVVPRVASACTVDLVVEAEGDDRRGRLERVAHASDDMDAVRALAVVRARLPADAVPTHPIRRVMETGESFYAPDVPDALVDAAAGDDPEAAAALRRLRWTSVIIVPLAAHGRMLGALTLGTTGARARFDERDLALARQLAQRAAVSVENARLHAAEQRARAEAEVARREAERAREQAEGASRAKSDFLATMSHELRTPLNAIAGYVELIEMGVHGPVTDGQRDDLARVRRNQRHLLGLIEALLTFAKMESGQTRYDVGAVPMDETLRVVEELIAPQLRAKALRYEYRRTDAALTARADREKVLQIVLNLVANAQKFTEPGGSITLTCEPLGGDRIAVRVRDTGCGIAAGDLERIFEPFVQAGVGGLTRQAGGTGLGLAISREFARAMGGDLRVESTLGAGSTFTLVLAKG